MASPQPKPSLLNVSCGQPELFGPPFPCRSLLPQPHRLTEACTVVRKER